MKKRKANYIITQEFKTSRPNLTEKELKDIFNKKYFKCIMRQEKIFLIIQILKMISL